MNIDINVNTEIDKELEEIHLQVSIAQDKMRKQIIYLKDKATREALIALGWTPPWNYNMEESPKDGTSILLKECPMFEGDEPRTYTGSWRVDEGFSGNNNPLWLDDSHDDWSTGYASMPLNPIAWKPIID